MLSKGILKAETHSETVSFERYQYYRCHTTGDEI